VVPESDLTDRCEHTSSLTLSHTDFLKIKYRNFSAKEHSAKLFKLETEKEVALWSPSRSFDPSKSTEMPRG
jgi:hypothetical protein